MDAHVLSLDQLISGDHEQCANPQCGTRFPFFDGKFQRVRGPDAKWYCDSHCASGPYLTTRTVRT
jgi:hypothetical protein